MWSVPNLYSRCFSRGTSQYWSSLLFQAAPSISSRLIACLFSSVDTKHITSHLAISHRARHQEDFVADRCFWGIRLWKPWIILSSWMKAWLFHSAKKALKNEHWWKRIHSEAKWREHILIVFFYCCCFSVTLQSVLGGGGDQGHERLFKFWFTTAAC